jgi:hypothetical protein
MKAWQYMPFEESLKETEHILFDLPGKPVSISTQKI